MCFFQSACLFGYKLAGHKLRFSSTANSITTFVEPNGAGKVLVGGRFWVDTPASGSARYVSSLIIVDSTTQAGDATVQAAGANSKNINETTKVVLAGQVFVRGASNEKESTPMAAAWDSANSVWWVLLRSKNSTSHFVMYLLKVSTTGTVTSYSTTCGGSSDLNDSVTYSNYHCFPKSILVDSTSLVITFDRGYVTTTPASSDNDRVAAIAKYTIASQAQSWAPASEALVAATDTNGYGTTPARGVVKIGTDYLFPYFSISSDGLKVAKFAASNLAPGATGFFHNTSVTFDNIAFGSTPTIKTTSGAYLSANSDSFIVGGYLRKDSSSKWNGFLAFFDSDDGTAKTGYGPDGIYTFQYSNSSVLRDTVLYNLKTGNCSNNLFAVGIQYVTNWKPFILKLNLNGGVVANGSNWGTSGMLALSEFDNNEVVSHVGIDSTSSNVIWSGYWNILSTNDVWRPTAYFNAATSCTDETMKTYPSSCSWNAGLTTTQYDASTITPTFTVNYSSGSPDTTVALSQVALSCTNAAVSKNSSDATQILYTCPSSDVSNVTCTAKLANDITCSSAPASFTCNTIPACSNSVDATRVNDCYNEGSSPNYAQDLAIGTQRQGPSGTTLTLQYANGSSGFKIWTELNGSRILNATGLVANGWQQTLTRAGTAFSGSNFTTGSNLAGRVCPPNVFLSHSDMVATGRCLYYDGGNATQVLNADNGAGTTEAEDWLTDWNRAATGRGTSSSYYEGNIKTCADKGMRLPTHYETTDVKPSTKRPTGDGLGSDPTWAGSTNGVPVPTNAIWTWTASAESSRSNGYWGWKPNGVHDTEPYTLPHTARCVLP